MLQAPRPERHPSFARTNGREAIQEAIRNHQERLTPNKTKAAIPYEHTNPRAVPFHVGDKRSDPISQGVGRAAHWAYYGKKPGAGLDAVPRELGHMFDPRSRAGIANIASMFAGGPKGDEMGGFDMRAATRVMDKAGMKGQFGPYSVAANRAAGHLVENDMQAPQFREALQNQRFNRNAYKANDFLAKRGNAGQGWNPMGPEAIAGFRGNSLAARQALYQILFGPKNEVFSPFPIPRNPNG